MGRSRRDCVGRVEQLRGLLLDILLKLFSLDVSIDKISQSNVMNGAWVSDVFLP